MPVQAHLLAEPGCFDTPSGLDAMDRFLQQLENQAKATNAFDDEIDIRVLWPENVWDQNPNTTVALTAIFNRYSAWIQTTSGRRCAGVKVVSGKLSTAALNLLRELLVDGANLIALTLALGVPSNEVRLQVSGRSDLYLLYRTDLNSRWRVVAQFLARWMAWRHATNTKIVIIGTGDLSRLRDHASRFFPFAKVSIETLKSSPSKGQRDSLKKRSERVDTLVCATKQVGHAHTRDINCRVASGTSWSSVRAEIDGFLSEKIRDSLTRAGLVQE